MKKNENIFLIEKGRKKVEKIPYKGSCMQYIIANLSKITLLNIHIIVI